MPPQPRVVIGMLLSRLVLFGAFQALVALGYALAGAAHPWERSIAWWPVSAAAGSLVVLVLLRGLLRREGARYRDLLRIDRSSVGVDVLIVLGLLAASAVVATLPGSLVATALWGDAGVGSETMIRPLPAPVALVTLVAFPILIGLTELPTYFGYVMPRLRRLTGSLAVALALSAAGLALQHVTLPLVFDAAFVAWRALMFLPFAFLVGGALAWRPRLMPYLVIVHVLLDLAAAAQVYLVST